MPSPSALFIRLAAASSIALCALPRAAVADGLLLFGTSDEGGGTNAFETIIDLKSGHERTTVAHGRSSDQSGFDGQFWTYVNGATNMIDMPSEVADRRAQMWVRQSAFRISAGPRELKRRVVPPNASPIDITFDPRTRRVSTATIEGDYGPVAFTLGDWRRLGSYDYPFRLEMDSDEGAQINLIQSARLVPSVHQNLLSRPSTPAVAHLDQPATTFSFKSIGNQKNHILAPATVNGTPVEFIFDTGAANILTIDAAKRLRIDSSGGINISGVGEGHENGGYGQVDAVSMGAATLEDQSFLIIPSPFGESKGKPSEIAGSLGYEFLAHFVTTIDYRAETMTLRKSVPSGQKGVRMPFVMDGHNPAVVAKVNGSPAVLRLDTGYGGTVTFFPTYAAAQDLDRGAGAVEVAGGGAGGSVRASSGKLARFSLGTVDFTDLPVQFSKNKRGAFASRYLAGNLGAGVLRCFRVTFDYPHHQLWLEPQLDTPGCIAAPHEPA